MNAKVPVEKLQAINRQIAQLRLDDKVQHIIDDTLKDTIPPSCREKAPHVVDADVMAPFMALAVGPPVLVVVKCLICGHVLECLAQRQLAAEGSFENFEQVKYLE